jgi:predicted ATPase/DNA-binding CsgD family transcriptional regulator
MKTLLAELIQEPKAGLGQFFDASVALCKFLAGQHAAGVVLETLLPQCISVDLHTEQVELGDPPSDLELCLPYMSPEQTGRLKAAADARSDLYSVGVVFYELLTGELPFEAKDALGWSYAHTSLQPKSPADLDPDIPQVIGEIVLKLLAKNPAERYQSAFSLQVDLERCRDEWLSTGSVAYFDLGQADSLRGIGRGGPLVGRDGELARLTEAFQRVCTGRTEIALVAGFPGTGKTALVEAFRRTDAAAKVDFVRGDVDQYRTSAPYAPLVQILRERIRQILAGDPGQLALWRDRFRKVLGKDGARIGELIPELELVAGEFETAAYESVREAEQRFRRAFSEFLHVALGGPAPLVVFLDNLQWIDAASCQMICSLLDNAVESRLLFIGAYRCNEMDSSHPFLAWVGEAKARGDISISTMELDVLAKPQTAQLIRSLVHLEDGGLEPLLEDVYQKSAGNPFHVKQILQKLNEDGLLTFSPKGHCWQYRGEGLKEMALPQDVVDLVKERIKRLPLETVELLKIAACLKQPFSLEGLGAILGQPPGHIRHLLQPAVEAAIAVESDEDSGDGSAFAFLHARIRETAYALLGPLERKKIHQRAGRRFLEAATGDASSLLFEAVDHLNESAELIATEAEQLELAHLNLEAANRAKAVIAFQAALRYLAFAVKLLPSDHWHKAHQLSYDIFTSYYYCTFVLNGFASAEPIFHEIVSHAQPGQELIGVYELKTILCTGYHTDDEAIKAGITGLMYHGLKLPVRPKPWNIAWVFLGVTLLFLTRPFKALLHQPEMEDPWAQRTMELLASLVPPTSLVNPELFVYVVLKMNYLTLKYGRCDASAFAFACYPIVAYGLGLNLPKVRRLQDIALELAETSSPSIRYRTYYVVSAFLNFWHKHLRTSLDYARQVYAAAYEHGDTLFAGAAVTELVQVHHALGESLDELAAVNEMALGETTKYGMLLLVDIHEAVNVYIKSLRGELEEYTIPESVVQRMLHTDSAMIVPYHYLMKIQVSYLRGDYLEAYGAVKEISDKLEALRGKILYAAHIFWACLASAAVYDRLDSKEQRKVAKALNRYVKQLRKWARWCPVNFFHKYKLALAELPYRRSDHWRRIKLYQEAISSAEKHGYVLDAAVASELAARHYEAMGMEHYRETYQKKAQSLYARFGASAKARLLEESPAVKSASQSDDGQGAQVRGARPEINGQSLPAEVSRMADILTVSKVLDSFLASDDSEAAIKQLFEVIVASSGAQRVYLFALDSTSKALQALAFREANGSVGFVTDPERALSELVSKAVVSYVINAGEPVLVDNALDSTVFGQDTYILTKKPLSIQCLPIYLDDELGGVLYLENNLTPGAFSGERMDIVQKLGALALSSAQVEREEGAVSAPELESLTNQERRIFDLMVQGLSNREIGKQLYLSEGTVKWHTNKIFKKLGVQSRTQAVVKAAEWGVTTDKDQGQS